MDFGLTSLDELQDNQDRGAEVRVNDPGTDNVLITIRVAGPDSKQQDRARERMTEEDLARGANTPLTREEQRQRGTRFLARCIMGWSWPEAKNNPHGRPEWSEDAAYELLTRYPYVRALVDNAAGSRLLFTKRSQTA